MRKSSPSDLTDGPGEVVKPLIPASSVGRPRQGERQEGLNTIFYRDRSGCRWDLLPHDLVPEGTV